MDDKSENPETIPQKEPTIPEKEPIIPEQKKTEPPPQPKARGRPKGVKDAKPRIKRVPVQQEEEEPPPPQVKKIKRVEVQEKPAEAIKREEPPTEDEDEEDEGEEAPLPQSKSPRTLHRERMHQAATERRQFARDRQDRFERILDNFMGF